MAQDLIYNIVKGKNTLTPELNGATRASDKLSKSTKTIPINMLAAAKAATAIAAAFTLKRAIEESLQLESALTGLRSVARNTGNDIKETEEAAKALSADGIIPLTESTAALKNLLSSGLNLEQSIKLLNTFRDAAAFNRQGQLELGTSVLRATEGFKNRLSILVDNVGITKNLSQIEKEYARATGKSTANIDERTRSQILANGLIKEGALFQGDYNKLLDTGSGAISNVTGSFRFLLAETGDLITKNSLFISTLNGIANAIKFVTEQVKTVNEQLKDQGPVQRLAEVKQEIGFVTREYARLVSNKRTFADVIFGSNKDELLNKLRALKKEQADLQKQVSAPAELGGGKVNAENAPEVQLERQKQEILNNLRKEQAEKEAELKLLREEEELAQNETKLANLENQLRLESELKQIYAEKEKTDKAKNIEDLRKVEADGARRALKEKATQEKAKLKLAQQTTQAQIGVASAAVELGAALAKEGNKAVFLAQKALAAAQIIITGQAAEAAALAPPPIGAGPIAGAGLASLIRAKTVLSLATVAATTVKGFNNGGPLSEGTRAGDSVIFRGNKDEGVFTRAQMSELFNIANGRGPERQENQTNETIVLNVDGREIARVVRDQVKDGFVLA